MIGSITRDRTAGSIGATGRGPTTIGVSERPDLSATSIFLFIQNKGYSGSLRTVERRVGEIKAAKPKERYFEQEYTPGEQSQFDFKESVTIPFTHGETIGHLFIATLPYSDCFFAKAFPNKTYEAFADGFHSFFEFTGGMTESVRFDNLTPVVKKVRLFTRICLLPTSHNPLSGGLVSHRQKTLDTTQKSC